jgi:hypothetical protein
MQAPLRKGKKEETLGRAKGVMRTGRSLLFGLLLIGIATLSSLVYTWQRLVVESMLDANLNLETRLDLIEKKTETLKCEVAALEAMERVDTLARGGFGMVPLSWKDVIVIEQLKGRSE